jgi:hypothetical protein
MDRAHFRRLESAWDGPSFGPACRTLVPAAGRLLCLDVVNGRSVGGTIAEGKLLLLQWVGASWEPWRVVDRDEATILSGGAELAGDESGQVHVLYASQDAASRRVEARYLRAPLPALAASSPSGAKRGGKEIVPSLERDDGILSQRIALPTQGVALAIDPGSGHALAASTFHGAATEKYPLFYMIRDGGVGTPSPVGDFGGDANALIASAGNDRYHVVIGYTIAGHGHIVYFLRSGDEWSKQVDLADATHDITAISTSLWIAADKGAVFVTWVDAGDRKARGRWLHVN